jgi:hypothetical protein
MLDRPHRRLGEYARTAFLERGQLKPLWLADWWSTHAGLTERQVGRHNTDQVEANTTAATSCPRLGTTTRRNPT